MADPWNDSEFDVLLSGGGFRATLFHLGVVRFLVEKKLICRVRSVFSVSGGSILAGFLAVNWSSFTSLGSFDQAAQQVIAYCQSDARNRLLRRWFAYLFACGAIASLLISIWLFGAYDRTSAIVGTGSACLLLALIWYGKKHCSRIAMFQSDLAHRLRPCTKSRDRVSAFLLKDLPKPDDCSPEFNILVTDLTTGQPWAFTRRGVTMGLGVASTLVCEGFKLSDAIVASAAFPPLFGPVLFARSNDANALSRDHFLADGGVFDNLGYAFAIAQPGRNRARKLLVCDAERCFEAITEDSYSFVIGRTIRSTDILMNRVSSFCVASADVKRIALGTDVEYPDADFPVTAQRLVRTIRTDLNHFSAAECQLLVAKGYLAACEALGVPKNPNEIFEFSVDGMPLQPRDDSQWLPFSSDQLKDQQVDVVLRNSHLTPRWPFSKRDIFGQFAMILAFLLLLALNPLGLKALGYAWRHLPPWPTAPEGSWYSSENEAFPPQAKSIQEFQWAYVSPTPGAKAACGVFVSEQLANAYGWWPQGEYCCEFLCAEPFCPKAVSAFVVEPGGRLVYLKPTVQHRRFLIDVPAGSSLGRLCVAVRAVPDRGTSPPDFKLTNLISIRVISSSEKQE